MAAAGPGMISRSGSLSPCCHKLMAQQSDMSPLPCFLVGTFEPAMQGEAAEQDMLLDVSPGELL